MKYFEVEREYFRGAPLRCPVRQDGTDCGDEYETSAIIKVCTGFNVNVLNEDGRIIAVQFYPVVTHSGDWSDNSEEVLAQIKRDFPPDEYQNADW